MSSYLTQYTQQLKKALEKPQLAPFYLIKAHNQDHHFEAWFKSLFTQVICARQKIEPTQADHIFQNGHEDLLVIRMKEAEKKYKIDDPLIQDFFRFQQFSAHSWSQRFVILFDADKLSDQILNKMLKTLEEPQEKTTIIFLSPSYKKLMPTIESRSVLLRKPLEANESYRHFESFQEWQENYRKSLTNDDELTFFDKFCGVLKGKSSYSEFFEYSQKYECAHDKLITYLEAYITNSREMDYRAYKRAQELFNKLKSAEIFYQSHSVRWQQILSFLQTTMQSP